MAVDSLQAIVAATLGGVFGGLGALIGTRIKNEKYKTVPAAILVATAVSFAGPISKNQTFRDLVNPPSKIELRARIKFEELIKSPGFKEKFEGKSQEEILQISAKTKLGLRLLSLDDLILWNSLKLKLAESDEKVCAGFWTGDGLAKSLPLALDRLNDKDFEDWFALSLRAAILHHENKNSENTVNQGQWDELKWISLSLPLDENKKFMEIFSRGTQNSAADSCFAIKHILKGVDVIPGKYKEAFLRKLAAI